jgi:hypothetical protein
MTKNKDFDFLTLYTFETYLTKLEMSNLVEFMNTYNAWVQWDSETNAYPDNFEPLTLKQAFEFVCRFYGLKNIQDGIKEFKKRGTV